MIAPIIFALREMGEKEEMMIDWKFQNVTFVLNILDSLAGDDRFVDIRKRTRPHRILTKIGKIPNFTHYSIFIILDNVGH